MTAHTEITGDRMPDDALTIRAATGGDVGHVRALLRRLAPQPSAQGV